jgi:hypothetical protein
VLVDHPQLGRYFDAFLLAHRCTEHAGARNEEAGLRTLLRYGFGPQRTATLIYWQAVKLLWKGVGPTGWGWGWGWGWGAGAGGGVAQIKCCLAVEHLPCAVRVGGCVTPWQYHLLPACLLQVSFVPPPSKAYREKVHGGATHPRLGCLDKHFVWRDAADWPWKDQQQ